MERGTRICIVCGLPVNSYVVECANCIVEQNNIAKRFEELKYENITKLRRDMEL